jgi:hypothetical protein
VVPSSTCSTTCISTKWLPPPIEPICESRELCAPELFT